MFDLIGIDYIELELVKKLGSIHKAIYIHSKMNYLSEFYDYYHSIRENYLPILFEEFHELAQNQGNFKFMFEI